MGENSSIEWTHHTWSPWEGCQKTGSLACENCYADARNARFSAPKGQPRVALNWGPHAERRLTADAGWSKPLALDRAAARHGEQERIFPSLCDPFDNKAPAGARVRFGKLILATPNLIWLLLTKRIGNAAAMLAEMFPDGVPTNVWIGATVVTQEEADRDIPKLLATPAAKRFLSIEPMMGPIDLTAIEWDVAGYRMHGALRVPGEPDDFRYWSHEQHGIDWVIVGGESGRGARPMHPDWVISLRDQCEAAGTPFLFKQWGEHLPVRIDTIHHSGIEFRRVGKKAAGRRLHGMTHDGVPA